MHSKRRYKILIRSIILGQLESFQNYKAFSIIFPQILDAISDSSLRHNQRQVVLHNMSKT